ncbi:hypothetical protein C8R43DRAFT_473838 [Mycena crocata]|nr:hypothetical protein C8R43DRAFT_473838 [Mycena crocata]
MSDASQSWAFTQNSRRSIKLYIFSVGDLLGSAARVYSISLVLCRWIHVFAFDRAATHSFSTHAGLDAARPQSTTTNSLSTGAIFGIIVGMLVLLGIVAAIMFYLRRRNADRFTLPIEAPPPRLRASPRSMTSSTVSNKSNGAAPANSASISVTRSASPTPYPPMTFAPRSPSTHLNVLDRAPSPPPTTSRYDMFGGAQSDSSSVAYTSAPPTPYSPVTFAPPAPSMPQNGQRNLNAAYRPAASSAPPPPPPPIPATNMYGLSQAFGGAQSDSSSIAYSYGSTPSTPYSPVTFAPPAPNVPRNGQPSLTAHPNASYRPAVNLQAQITPSQPTYFDGGEYSFAQGSSWTGRRQV